MTRMMTALMAIAVAGSTMAGTAQAAPAKLSYDVIIRNGTVFDGTGAEGRAADVGIVGDRVVAIGDLSGASAALVKDATGLYVSPGFVSIHDHSAPTSYARPEGILTQGVTTAITNPDGGGELDIVKQLSVPLGLNYGGYIGFNSVWGNVVGFDNRRATPEEIDRMKALVLKGLEDGAFGLSSGLDYKPSFWATTDEVIAVGKVGSNWRTNFTNHERVFPGNGYSSMAGMKETVEIGEKAGMMPVITHMKLQGHDNGKTVEALALATDAKKQGYDVGMDAYPYTYGSTSLEQLTIPSWAQEGGRDAMLKRFKDPALRSKIIADTNEQIETRWLGPKGVYIVDIEKRLPVEMAARGNISGGEAIVQLLEEGNRRVLLSFGTEEDQAALLKDPLQAVSCDCGANTSKVGHPRNWGSFPRFMGRYVREQQLVSWGEAVRKMTALPAAMVGLSERGYLLPGMVADITLFDPKTVIDQSTVEAPTLPSIGIATVIVNGKVALDGGKMADGTFGTRLVRSRHEPSRPMNFDVARSVSAKGSVGGATVAINLAQAAGAAAPTGKVSVKGLPGGTLSFTPSILQTTKGWASVTGTGQRGKGKVEAITLQFEQADPFGDSKPTLRVLADGKPILEGALPAGGVTVTEGGR
jgi:N-acyl-D-amino-acid deacylase